MLRNRRGAVQSGVLAGRATTGGSPTPRTLEQDIDERSPQVHALLEEWRDSAVAFLGRDDGQASALGVTEEGLEKVFRLLFLAAGTWLELLGALVALRLHPECRTPNADLAETDQRTLQDGPRFPGEREVLEGLAELIAVPSEEGDRIRLLELALQNIRKVNKGGPPPKCVVFTSHSRVCREILQRVQASFGAQAVAGYHAGLDRARVEQAITRFRTHPTCFVLVCDPAGEEGRNLQFAERVIHFDLPLSPNRMEQRIGRLDRIGRDRPVRSTVFIGPATEDSLFEAWYRVLDEGFRVFDRSIASLQFFVEEHLPRLTRTLFREGAPGLLALVPEICSGIAKEQERIDEQDALDAIDAYEQNAAACFEDIQRLEAAHEDLEEDLHVWVGEALHFRRDPDFYRSERTTLYGPDMDRWGALRTLVPADWLQHRLSRHLEHPGAFDRRIALRVRGTPVLRIGEGFVDAMASYVGWDDRGQAFALWRHWPAWSPAEGAEWVGFRFNYAVTADLREARQVLAQFGMPRSAVRSLQRRADAILPPLIEVVFLDTDGRTVADPDVLAILGRPYLAHDKGGSDYNLANERLAAIDPIVPPSRWPDLCAHARAASSAEVLTRGEPPLRERCAAFAEQAGRGLGLRLAQLRLRLGREQGERSSGGTVSARDIEIEEAVGAALVRGIHSPQLRLDSIGFIVVSGRPPSALLVAEEQ